MSALVLGATSPIARATARAMAKRGHDVYVAARDLDEARRLALDLEVRHQVRAVAGTFDALDFEQHGAFITAVTEAVGPIDVALVAFGDMGDQDTSQADFTQAHRVIDVNYTGAVSICERIAEAMLERGAGTLIGLSSVAGDRGRASNYIYGSAKGAFTLYLQGLRNRLFSQGVHVMTVKLGFVDTPMTFGLKTPLPVADPDATGEAIVRAAEQRRDMLYHPAFWAGVMGIIKNIPEAVFKRMKL